MNTKRELSIFETPLSSLGPILALCSLPARTALRYISVAGVDDGPEVGVEGGEGEGDEHLGCNSVVS